jgi:hypothetical protein
MNEGIPGARSKAGHHRGHVKARYPRQRTHQKGRCLEPQDSLTITDTLISPPKARAIRGTDLESSS